MADFTLVVDNVLEENIQFDTLVSEAENGYEQRRSRRDTPLRAFNLVFNNRTLVEMQAIRDFFILKKGSCTSFTWVNPNDSVEYTVRFADDALKPKRKMFNLFDLTAKFVEVRA
jgi:phage-related protein